MDRVRAGFGGWKGRVHVKGGHGWAGLVLTPPGTEEGKGFEEGHYFIFSVLICMRFRILQC